MPAAFSQVELRVGRQNDSAWSAFLQHRLQVIVECRHEPILGFR